MSPEEEGGENEAFLSLPCGRQKGNLTSVCLGGGWGHAESPENVCRAPSGVAI